MEIVKIISGGQTGADRGGLEAGLANNIPLGGYCPAGRRAEDGKIPYKYPMKQTSSKSYNERTELNVINADHSIIVIGDKLTAGTALTIKLVKRNRGTCSIIKFGTPLKEAVSIITVDLLKHFTVNMELVLNVAGPRESSYKGMEKYTTSVMDALIKEVNKERSN